MCQGKHVLHHKPTPTHIESPLTRLSFVHGVIVASGDKEQPSAVGEILQPSSCDSVFRELSTSDSGQDPGQRIKDASPDPRSSGDLVIWESSSSDSGQDSDQRIKDASPDPRSSGDPVIWESSSSGSTSSMDQRAEDAPLRFLSSSEPVISEAWSAVSEHPSERAPPSLSSNGDGHDSVKNMSGVIAASPPCDEENGALVSESELRISCSRSRLETSTEQEQQTASGNEVLPLSPSSSGGASADTAAAMVAGEDRTLGLLGGSDASSDDDDAIVEETLAGVNRLSGSSDDVTAEVRNPSLDGAAATRGETSTSDAASNQQHIPTSSPTGNGAAAATSEEKPPDSKVLSMWPVDLLEIDRDPLGDVS